MERSYGLRFLAFFSFFFSFQVGDSFLVDFWFSAIGIWSFGIRFRPLEYSLEFCFRFKHWIRIISLLCFDSGSEFCCLIHLSSSVIHLNLLGFVAWIRIAIQISFNYHSSGLSALLCFTETHLWICGQFRLSVGLLKLFTVYRLNHILASWCLVFAS